MDLQELLITTFTSWKPEPPRVEGRSKRDVTLSFSAGPFSFLREHLLYKVQRKEKTPPWVTVYREKRPWLESAWSEETWTSTDSDGASAACFCMAVRCGYLKQVQQMLEERPELISAINSSNGFTPLATAARKGDVNMVRFLLAADAEVDQRSATGQTPLHLAVLAGHTAVAELLLEKGADFQACDINGLRTEHYAVDSGDAAVLEFALERGQMDVRDNRGWTPLFRAICQGAKTDVITRLVDRGSDVNVTDKAGLTLIGAARLLKNRHGRHRDSVLKLVDTKYQHEKAVAHFTRITKKISSIQTLLNFK